MTAVPDVSVPVAVQATENPSSIANLATGGYPFPGVPIFKVMHKKRQWAPEHMAGAFRVLARREFIEGTSGHISLRDPVDPTTFWINPFGRHFGMLKASDMVQVNEDGQVVGGNKVAVNAAGFKIHSTIHKARPDVHAAVHGHSKAGKAWSAFGKPLDIMNQDTCNFWDAQVVYASFGGVVLDDEEGKRIADALGERGRMLIHGLLTTGETVDEAAYMFTLEERSCEIQIMVESTGLPKRLIGEKEAQYTAAVNAPPGVLYTEFQPDFEYEIWKSNGELIADEPTA